MKATPRPGARLDLRNTTVIRRNGKTVLVSRETEGEAQVGTHPANRD